VYDKLNDLIRELCSVASDPKGAVKKAMNNSGKQAIGCFPVYIPEEIIYAAGFLPIGLWGGKTDMKKADQYLQNFCCSVMRANMDLAIRGTYDLLAGIVATGYCDTLKCMILNFRAFYKDKPVIGFVCPQNRDEGLQYLIREMEYLATELEHINGWHISDSDVERSIAVYEAYRTAAREFVDTARDYPKTFSPLVRHQILKAAFFMDKAVYAQKLSELNQTVKTLPKEQFNGIRAVVTGIMMDSPALLNALNSYGITIVADDLAQESRQFRTSVKPQGAPLERVARRILDIEGCSLLYEKEKNKAEFILQTVRESGAEAVIVCMTKFCDPEEFDYPLLQEGLDQAGVKSLYIEVENHVEALGQMNTRIQSFSEMF